MSGTCMAQGEITLSTPQKQVGKYEKLELPSRSGGSTRNPFDPCEVEVNVLITGPSGRSLALPAFFGQDYERQDVQQGGQDRDLVLSARYRVLEGAICADGGRRVHRPRVVEGSDKARSRLCARDVYCVASSRKGFLRTGTKDPRFLEFTEGAAVLCHRAECGVHRREPVRHAGQGRADLRQAGGQRRELRAHLDLLPGLGVGHRGPEERLEPLVGTRSRSWCPMPGARATAGARKCIRLKGDNGASLTASPSHPVGLRPGTRYVFTGRFKTEGCKALRVQVGSNNVGKCPRHPAAVPTGRRSARSS